MRYCHRAVAVGCGGNVQCEAHFYVAADANMSDSVCGFICGVNMAVSLVCIFHVTADRANLIVRSVAVVAIFVFAVTVVAGDGKGLGNSSLEVADALNGHGSGTGIHIFSIGNGIVPIFYQGFAVQNDHRIGCFGIAVVGERAVYSYSCTCDACRLHLNDEGRCQIGHTGILNAHRVIGNGKGVVIGVQSVQIRSCQNDFTGFIIHGVIGVCCKDFFAANDGVYGVTVEIHSNVLIAVFLVGVGYFGINCFAVLINHDTVGVDDSYVVTFIGNANIDSNLVLRLD